MSSPVPQLGKRKEYDPKIIHFDRDKLNAFVEENTNKKVKSVVRQNLPSPPPSNQLLSYVPSSPLANKRSAELIQTKIFPGGTCGKVENDLTPLKEEFKLDLDTVYTDFNGTKHNVFQQPLYSKSGWAYCLAMLLTDVLRRGQHCLKIEANFWEWFQKAYSEHYSNIKQKAEEIGLKLEHSSIPVNEPLPFIREKIENSGFPVLATIEHPQLRGHVVVIDQVTDDNTTLRDPFSGKVWVVSNESMKNYFKDEISDQTQQHCLSVARQGAN